MQDCGQLGTRHDDPAQEELRKDEGGHELHGLELGGSERAHRKTQSRAQQGVKHRYYYDQPRLAAHRHAVGAEAQSGDHQGLNDGGHPEGDRVAEYEVGLAHGHGEQALERPTGALPQGGHRRDQEHHNQREDAEKLRPEGVEVVVTVVEDPGQQPHEHCRDGNQQCHRARVVAQLQEHSPGCRSRPAPVQGLSSPAAGPPRSPGTSLPISATNADSKSSLSVLDSRPAGVVSARIRPSRMSRSRSQRSASSMTWLETSRVVPAAASRWKSDHRLRRNSGSRPTVGSSSTRRLGESNSAVASDTRARSPPDSRPTIEAARSQRSTSVSTCSTASADAPRMVAKYDKFSCTVRSP